MNNIHSTKAESQLLDTEIKFLPLSENFCLRSKLMGFTRLKHITVTPVNVLLSKEDFNYDWLGELSRFMTGKGLLHLLQPVTGSRD